MIRGSIKVGLAILSLMSVVPVTAKAQDQTVEGAQAFLREVAARGTLQFSRLLPGQEGTLSGAYISQYVQSTSSPESCVTDFHMGRTIYAADVAAVEGEVIRVDWTRIDSVERRVFIRNNLIVISPSPSPGWTSTVFVQSEEMNTRIMFAMNFLKLNCDPTSATGF